MQNKNTNKKEIIEEFKQEIHEGICLILPKHETIRKAKKIGSNMMFINVSFDRFGFGIQLLKHGIILQIGFFNFGISSIKKQSDFYEI